MNRTSSRRALAAAAAIICLGGLVLLNLLTLHGYYRIGDVVLYHRYALNFWQGKPPFHSLPREYPPFSVLPFSLTLLVAGRAGFMLWFGIWMSLLAIAGFGFIAWAASWPRAITYAVYLLVGAAGTLLGRYDLWPALLSVVAVVAIKKGRWNVGYVFLALATLLKLYPMVLLPIFLIEQHRRKAAIREMLAGSLLAIGTVSMGYAAAAVLNPAGWSSSFGWLLKRPFEVESIYASAIWVASRFGVPVHFQVAFGSYNLISPLDPWLRPASLALLIGGCLLVYWRHARGQLGLGAAAFAALTVLVVTAKVLSPQYLLWILPLAALEQGFQPMWLTICLFTSLAYPIAIDHGKWPWLEYSANFLTLLVIRNLLLIGATVISIWPVKQQPTVVREPAHETSTWQSVHQAVS